MPVRTQLPAERPKELVKVVHAPSLPGAQFWRVEHSERHWSMLHDTFTACLVRGPSALSARWSSRGAERSVGAGGVQLMEPGEIHKTTRVSEPASFFVVWWEPELLDDAAARLELGTSARFALPQSEAPELRRALSALAAALEGGADALSLECRFAEATRTVLECGNARDRGTSPRLYRHPSVRRALEYLQECFADNVSLDELARESRLSKFHFARSFRASTGVAPHQYLSLLRLQAARRHLERGVSVEESAALTGFADGPHLSRAFRRWLGTSPGSWGRASRCASLPGASA